MEPGRSLTHYELVEPIGAGGMGQVWRARDTRLGRDVAIKVLPPHFADDAERLRRFEREANALARLSHPHVAQIHGFDRDGDTVFLVLELVRGASLAARLERGPLSVDEAVELCRQIAEGLEAAHEAALVHRDLKPANVVVGDDGRAKVLDFGLAKDRPHETGSVDTTIGSDSLELTADGVVLGTPTYMSPEQARGRPTDRRTDIWAFGCVLFECLTGERAFAGPSTADVLGAVLHAEPDWSRLPADTPRAVRRLLSRCLAKDPRRRLRDIGDARLELEEQRARGDEDGPVDAPRPGRPALLRGIAWAACGALAATAVLLGTRPSATDAPAPEPRRFTLHLEHPLARRSMSSVALSPDGRLLAYLTTGVGSETAGVAARALRIADLRTGDDRELRDLGDAYLAVFSPNGAWLAYASGDGLCKVPVGGGASIRLAAVDPQQARGASWGDDGSIVYTPGYESGLWRVPADGGEPERLTTIAVGGVERSHRWPHVLPGSRTVVFCVQEFGKRYDESRITILDLATRVVRSTELRGTCPRYAPTGHLTFVRGSTLFAVPFDPDRAVAIGDVVAVLDGVRATEANGSADYSFSTTGDLVHVRDDTAAATRRLAWLGRDGAVTALPFEPAAFRAIAIAPDGERVAAEIGDDWSRDVWIGDLSRGTLTPLSRDPAAEFDPAWSPDGEWLAFTSSRGTSVPNVFRQRADGAGEADRLVSDPRQQFVGCWTSDGRRIVFWQQTSTSPSDIFLWNPDADPNVRPIVSSRFTDRDATLSPRDRWLAYVTDETGRPEVWVAPFGEAGRRVRVSTDGGRSPRWSPATSELVFLTDDGIWAAAYDPAADTFRSERPGLLLHRTLEGGDVVVEFDVAPDGRLLTIVGAAADQVGPMPVLSLDWFAELPNRVAR